MNLKEIGTLLVGLFLTTSMLMGYKYFLASKSVYQISRKLVLKYVLRFIILLILLPLCYYLLVSKQQATSQFFQKNNYLLAVSASNSNLTWKQISDELIEFPSNGEYGLVLYDSNNDNWKQLIPSTNKEAFLNLVENEIKLNRTEAKRPIFLPISFNPTTDQYRFYILKGDQWVSNTSTKITNSFFSLNLLGNWAQSIKVPLYLVILTIILIVIDILFSVKSFKS
jgi:hypothetical protein